MRVAGSGEAEMVERGLDEAVSAMAREAVPDLLDEVVRRSREEAAQILGTRLTAAMVEAMEQLLAARSEPDRSAERMVGEGRVIPMPQAESSPPLSGWYVYGLTWEAAARSLDITLGVDDAPLQVVTAGAVAAVVSPVSTSAPWGTDPAGDLDLDQLAPKARRHEWVLEQMLERGAVLPLRFGVLYPTLERLEETLADQGPALAAALKRVDRHAEWGLTITIEDSKRPAPTMASGRAEGRGYLVGRRAERQAADERAEERAQAAASVHRALCGVSTDAVVHGSGGSAARRQRSVLRASYLVPAESESTFRAAAEDALAAVDPALALGGELTGPWPPYHFCDISLAGVPA